MAKIEELPVEGQLQTLFGDAKGVAGKVTMLAVGTLNLSKMPVTISPAVPRIAFSSPTAAAHVRVGGCRVAWGHFFLYHSVWVQGCQCIFLLML